jgi:hypothetical protein
MEDNYSKAVRAYESLNRDKPGKSKPSQTTSREENGIVYLHSDNGSVLGTYHVATGNFTG